MGRSHSAICLSDMRARAFEIISDLKDNVAEPYLLKSLMTESIGQVFQGHEMCCDDMEATGLNPDRVKLGMCYTVSEPKNRIRDTHSDCENTSHTPGL